MKRFKNTLALSSYLNSTTHALTDAKYGDLWLEHPMALWNSHIRGQKCYALVNKEGIFVFSGPFSLISKYIKARMTGEWP